MVFYRKYRPQTLSEVLGQETVRQTLEKAFLNGKLAHAYLFCGPKGTGKTSTARILAKMVNCQGKKVPCNDCAACLSVTDGSNLDLIEIDAASNRGIDDIRALRENIKLAPLSSNKKVYIIDEVHMLTNEAFNALLKTLEEPPEHVLFILATTDAHKIPPTILSRVQRLDFEAAAAADLVSALRHVVTGEKLEVDDSALLAIARKSDGSFRDSLKLLDQLAASGNKITAQGVEMTLSLAKLEDVVALLWCISRGDSRGGLELVSKRVEAGVNLKEYVVSLLEVCRAMLLINYGAKETAKEYLGASFDEVSQLAGQYSLERLVQVINLFQVSLEKAKTASIPSLPLEIAVVEGCLGVEEKEEKTMIPVDPPPIPDYSEVALSSQDETVLRDKWNYILETIKPYNFSLEALLKQSQIVKCDAGLLVLEVPYAFHQRILEAPKSRNLLESVLADILGKPIKASCVLGKRPFRAEELANVELAADDEVIKLAAEIFNSDAVS